MRIPEELDFIQKEMLLHYFSGADEKRYRGLNLKEVKKIMFKIQRALENSDSIIISRVGRKVDSVNLISEAHEKNIFYDAKTKSIYVIPKIKPRKKTKLAFRSW